jgi:propanol-preferring alcohol dehydrogenase
MRAMILEHTAPVEQIPLRSADVPVPEPGPGEIRLKVRACGACHTDLHTVEGDLELKRIPLIPGHQVVGTVDTRGRGSTLHKEGDRLGVTWLYSSCGECLYCREGRENLCPSAQFTGYHRDGGYAEYMVVPEQSAFPVPDIFTDIDATPLLCGGVIGYRALRLSEIGSKGKLGLYGFGNSAHIVIQIAVNRGCEVYVFTRSQNHQKLAAELGAVWVGTASDEPPSLMDSSIVFAPAGPLVLDALRVLRPGGTIALAGITMTPVPQMDYSLIYGERTVRSVANTTRKDAEELLAAAAGASVKSHVEAFGLEDANDVLRMMKHSELKAGAALVL